VRNKEKNSSEIITNHRERLWKELSFFSFILKGIIANKAVFQIENHKIYNLGT